MTATKIGAVNAAPVVQGFRRRSVVRVPRVVVVHASVEKPEVEIPKVQSTTPAPKPVAKGLGIYDSMAFAGPAPEIINGRLSMLGFVAALGAELSSNETVVKQFSQIPGPMIFVVALFTTASLIPLVKNGADRPTFGPFTPQAEMLNGRAAMIGFAALLIAEGVRGSALF